MDELQRCLYVWTAKKCTTSTDRGNDQHFVVTESSTEHATVQAAHEL